MRPSAADQADEGRRDPGVVLLTRAELEAKRLRVMAQLGALHDLPTEAELLDELDDIEFLLGVKRGDD